MEIRRAKPADIPDLIDLLKQVGMVHRLGRPDLFRADPQKYGEEELLELLADPMRPIFVADTGNRVAGYAFCIFKTVGEHPVLADVTSLYIDDLCVDETCRGQGIGTALYRHVCAFAREQGCHNVTLNVWAFNESAIRFYEKCGMKPQKIGMETILGGSYAGKERNL